MSTSQVYKSTYTAQGEAYTTNGIRVTSNATSSAESNISYEDALNKAKSLASAKATQDAQWSASIEDQILSTSTSTSTSTSSSLITSVPSVDQIINGNDLSTYSGNLVFQGDDGNYFSSSLLRYDSDTNTITFRSDIVPGTENISLGNAEKPFKEVFISPNTLYIGSTYETSQIKYDSSNKCVLLANGTRMANGATMGTDPSIITTVVGATAVYGQTASYMVDNISFDPTYFKVQNIGTNSVYITGTSAVSTTSNSTQLQQNYTYDGSINIVSTNVGNTGYDMYITCGNSNTSGNGTLYLNQYGGNVVMGSSGYTCDLNVKGTYTSYGNITSGSDYRIKEKVEPLDLEKYNVDNLKPSHYTNKRVNKEEFGFIAHELQEIFPFLVHGEKDGEEMQSVNYIGIIALLVKEIQEIKRKGYVCKVCKTKKNIDI